MLKRQAPGRCSFRGVDACKRKADAERGVKAAVSSHECYHAQLSMKLTDCFCDFANPALSQGAGGIHGLERNIFVTDTSRYTKVARLDLISSAAQSGDAGTNTQHPLHALLDSFVCRPLWGLCFGRLTCEAPHEMASLGIVLLRPQGPPAAAHWPDQTVADSLAISGFAGPRGSRSGSLAAAHSHAHVRAQWRPPSPKGAHVHAL